MGVTKLDHVLSPSAPLCFHKIFLLRLAMARCLEKGTQLPCSSLLMRPLCISLNIVFINKAEQKQTNKKNIRISNTRLTLNAVQFPISIQVTYADPYAARGMGLREKLQRQVQHLWWNWDPSIEITLQHPLRYPAQPPRAV